MNIKLYSHYDNFTWTKTPKLLHWNVEPYYWSCYEDEAVFMVKEKDLHSFALLIEPRSINLKSYEYVSQHFDEFAYVFTHDDELLRTLPNAKPIVFGGVYGDKNNIEKTKNISMISSNKKMCDLHLKRLDLIKKLNKTGIVDCYGTWNGGSSVSTYDAHAPYKFAVILENFISDYWFTEKICNCFANKCIPIYYGARLIDKYFDGNGIIRVDSIEEIPELVQNLDFDVEYAKRIEAVNHNYEIVDDYMCFEDTFVKWYGELLNKM